MAVIVPAIADASDVTRRAPLSPEEATQRDHVRRLLNVLTVLGLLSGGALVTQAILTGLASYWGLSIMVCAFVVVLAAWARPLLSQGRVQSAVTVMALTAIGLILGGAVIRPSGAVTVASLLVPVTAAVPYLNIKPLRRLMVLAWVGTIAAGAAALLPGAPVTPDGDPGAVFVTSTVVSGLVLFLLFRSSQSLKASNQEFRRLFSLSSDLAETTETEVLGDVVARHLTEAIGMDDCVLYSLVPETDRLIPFGSYPAQRSLQTQAQSVADRSMLRRVIHDRVRIAVDHLDQEANLSERARLGTLGRRSMLLLPLVAHSDPVGVAELTSVSTRSIDERRLALARTLAFEAAMAIENGRLHQELRQRSLHDGLTGLANRGLFMDRVGHAVARLGRNGGGFLAVLFVDLDNFKAVNDTLGHGRGDRLLTLVAERLLTAVRDVDTVARLGGDEFGLLLEDLTGGEFALAVAERVVDLVAAPFDLDGNSVNIGASIGLSVRSDDSTGTDTLIAEADAAMYEAKRSGKGRVVSSRR